MVADEIKDLAERSASSTREIADLIRAVQKASDSAINVVQRSASAVEEGVEVSREAERSLKDILDSIQRATTMIQQIAQATSSGDGVSGTPLPYFHTTWVSVTSPWPSMRIAHISGRPRPVVTNSRPPPM